MGQCIAFGKIFRVVTDVCVDPIDYALMDKGVFRYVAGDRLPEFPEVFSGFVQGVLGCLVRGCISDFINRFNARAGLLESEPVSGSISVNYSI